MAISTYLARLRACVGHDLLVHPSAGACIRDREGRILLLRRSDGLWSVPGGGMEPRERLEETVVREVREEIGLEVEPVALIGVYSSPEYIFAYPNGDRMQPIITFFECRVVGGEIVPDMEEILEARYFGPDDDLPALMTCCRAKVRDAFAFRGQAFFR
jgi:8-oxo-dGTP pyrophosphatase MutT (NUDIX family)